MASPPAVEISPEEKLQAVQRILNSQTFSRSDQLKRFLQYICEKDVEGNAGQINEYSIATEALGRPANYSPANDSSVRTRAHALRQKLQEYYDDEDPGAEVRIDVPRGAYSPVFSYHPLPVAAVPAPPITAESPRETSAPRRTFSKREFFAGALAATLLSSVLFSLLLYRGSAGAAATVLDPVVVSAWGQMLNRGQEVDVCIANPPAMLLHSYKDGTLPTFPALLQPAGKEISSWYDSLQMKDGGGKLYMHTTQDVFLFGDSLAAASAVQLLSRAGALPQVEPELNLQAFSLRGRNVLLIGSPNYSPLAARFLRNAPFSVHYDPISREEVVSDGPPGHGAKRVFRPLHDNLGRLTKAYGLLTVLPSQLSGEPGAQTVIFSGITSAGPQAALEFFRSPTGLRLLESKFQKEGIRGFPLAYQVVVGCGLDHNLALDWEYETHQVVKPSALLD
jgi:hypothetical protein